MTEEIVLAGAVRTAIGKFGGALAGTSPVELGTAVIAEALRRAGVAAAEVDEVIMGHVLQAGTGQNIARQCSVGAGIPIEVPGLTVNKVCGSGLSAVNLAAALIRSGEAEVVVVGGVESMSRAPYLLDKARFGYRLGEGRLIDTLLSEGLTDSFNGYHMGITAENIAERYQISRADQDAFAATSQQRAAAAQAAGTFTAEILPMEVQVGRERVAFDTDEGVRAGTTAASLGKLRPAFKPDGTVTAGNASGISDGAAALIVLSAKRARELGVTPMGTWLGGAAAGVDPAVMGRGPVESTRKVLFKTGTNLSDIGIVELNEAFAAQSLCVIRELGLDPELVNVHGGAIALGHPLGASGARILVTLLHEQRRAGIELGLASLCIGGGMGISTLVRMGE
ncbi:acetyl-CoA C-acyltransferase [Tessaracoccus sp. Z1128]